MSALALVLCSSGCARNSRLVVATPPASRLTCAPEPLVPATLTDATTADYIVRLAAAGQDCRSSLAWLRDWTATLNP